MKIIHLLQSPFFSGAENVVCQIMKLFSNDHNMKMIYLSPDGPIREAIESKGFTYIGLESFSVKSIRKVIEEQKPDIIHAHDISASILACISTVGLDVEIVSHVHVNNANMSKINAKTLLYCIFSCFFKHIFWVSPSCYDSYRFRTKLANKSTVLCNVMDRDDILNRAEQGAKDTSFDVIYVGRLVYQKNPERLMDVFEGVVQLLPMVKIGVAGDGELFNQVQNIARDKGLLKNVNFMGYQNNPLGYLSKSKVMVMTSRFEGLPMTVLESLALGVPVVSTPVDGLLNVIDNDCNGYLSDDNTLLIKSICDIVTNSQKRLAMSKNAKEKFEKICNLAKYKEALSDVYFA